MTRPRDITRRLVLLVAALLVFLPPRAEAAYEASPPAAMGEPGSEGARLIALNMALNGTPREETARYLAENFELDDADALLDDVYSRAG